MGSAMPEPGDPVAVVRLRRGVVGEARRVCHVVHVPGRGAIPESLTALCGEPLHSGETELLGGITGMPCELCLSRVAPAAARALTAAG